MANITRSSVIQKAVNDLGINVSADKTPNETLDKIQLGYDLNPRYSNVVRVVSAASTTAGTIVYTLGANEDFYLTSIAIQNMSDATADNTSITFNFTVDGVGRSFGFNKLTTTAFAQSMIWDFTYPIKLDKGSSLIFTNAFTVGASTSRCEFTGIKLSQQ